MFENDDYLKEWAETAIFEATAAKKRGIQLPQVLDQIEEYIKNNPENETNPRVFIHFTNLLKLGTNPRQSYDTPIGIFSYPLTSEILDDYRNKSLPFMGDSQYVFIFAQKPDKNIILDNISEQTFKEYIIDAKRLIVNPEDQDKPIGRVELSNPRRGFPSSAGTEGTYYDFGDGPPRKTVEEILALSDEEIFDILEMRSVSLQKSWDALGRVEGGDLVKIKIIEAIYNEGVDPSSAMVNLVASLLSNEAKVKWNYLMGIDPKNLPPRLSTEIMQRFEKAIDDMKEFHPPATLTWIDFYSERKEYWSDWVSALIETAQKMKPTVLAAFSASLPTLLLEILKFILENSIGTTKHYERVWQKNFNPPFSNILDDPHDDDEDFDGDDVPFQEHLEIDEGMREGVGISIENYRATIAKGMNGANIQTPLGKFWNITRLLGHKVSDIKRTKSPSNRNRTHMLAWGQMLRLLGIDGVVDMGQSLIHPNEPHQAVFFGKQAIRILGSFENPHANKNKKKKKKDKELISVRVGYPMATMYDFNQVFQASKSDETWAKFLKQIGEFDEYYSSEKDSLANQRLWGLGGNHLKPLNEMLNWIQSEGSQLPYFLKGSKRKIIESYNFADHMGANLSSCLLFYISLVNTTFPGEPESVEDKIKHRLNVVNNFLLNPRTYAAFTKSFLNLFAAHREYQTVIADFQEASYRYVTDTLARFTKSKHGQAIGIKDPTFGPENIQRIGAALEVMDNDEDFLFPEEGEEYRQMVAYQKTVLRKNIPPMGKLLFELGSGDESRQKKALEKIFQMANTPGSSTGSTLAFTGLTKLMQVLSAASLESRRNVFSSESIEYLGRETIIDMIKGILYLSKNSKEIARDEQGMFDFFQQLEMRLGFLNYSNSDGLTVNIFRFQEMMSELFKDDSESASLVEQEKTSFIKMSKKRVSSMSDVEDAMDALRKKIKAQEEVLAQSEDSDELPSENDNNVILDNRSRLKIYKASLEFYNLTLKHPFFLFDNDINKRMTKSEAFFLVSNELNKIRENPDYNPVSGFLTEAKIDTGQVMFPNFVLRGVKPPEPSLYTSGEIEDGEVDISRVRKDASDVELKNFIRVQKEEIREQRMEPLLKYNQKMVRIVKDYGTKIQAYNYRTAGATTPKIPFLNSKLDLVSIKLSFKVLFKGATEALGLVINDWDSDDVASFKFQVLRGLFPFIPDDFDEEPELQKRLTGFSNQVSAARSQVIYNNPDFFLKEATSLYRNFFLSESWAKSLYNPQAVESTLLPELSKRIHKIGNTWTNLQWVYESPEGFNLYQTYISLFWEKIVPKVGIFDEGFEVFLEDFEFNNNKQYLELLASPSRETLDLLGASYKWARGQSQTANRVSALSTLWQKKESFKDDPLIRRIMEDLVNRMLYGWPGLKKFRSKIIKEDKLRKNIGNALKQLSPEKLKTLHESLEQVKLSHGDITVLLKEVLLEKRHSE